MPEFLENFWLWTIEDAIQKELWWYGWVFLIILSLILWISKRIKKDLVSILSDEDGNVNFFKSVPSGFKVLTQDSMPTTTKGIPDLVWAKSRNNAFGGQILDSSRGVGNRLLTSGTNTEAYDANHLRKFIKGGYEVGNINVLNTASDGMVAWHWIANKLKRHEDHAVRNRGYRAFLNEYPRHRITELVHLNDDNLTKEIFKHFVDAIKSY